MRVIDHLFLDGALRTSLRICWVTSLMDQAAPSFTQMSVFPQRSQIWRGLRRLLVAGRTLNGRKREAAIARSSSHSA
jgi:hypothetical protein